MGWGGLLKTSLARMLNRKINVLMAIAEVSTKGGGKFENLLQLRHTRGRKTSDCCRQSVPNEKSTNARLGPR